MEEQKVASFQVAVGRHGRLIHEAAFGLANVEAGIRATTETMYLVASIAKPFTSTSVMVLAERGQIDLQAPIDDYLEGSRLVAYRGAASEATVMRLLLHTSGLPYGYYVAGEGVSPESRRTPKDIIDIAGVICSQPGSRFEYSNIGYNLFEAIVEDAAGEDLKGFMTREVIEPLGLTHTGFFHGQPPLDAVATQNHGGEALPVALDANGTSALYSTASDLVRFGMYHLHERPQGKRILTDSSLEMLWEDVDPARNVQSSRRMGWNVQDDFGCFAIQHSGGGPGMHNWLYLLPAEGVVVATMSNAWYPTTPETDQVLIDLVQGALAGDTPACFDADVGRGWPVWPEIDPSDLAGEWTGHVRGPLGSVGASLRVSHDGQAEVRIDGDLCSAGGWVLSSRPVKKANASLLWRFDACIPYLHDAAPHSEVILTVWPEGDGLVGHAAAAREKDFGHGEAYVLPQFLELQRIGNS